MLECTCAKTNKQKKHLHREELKRKEIELGGNVTELVKQKLQPFNVLIKEDGGCLQMI